MLFDLHGVPSECDLMRLLNGKALDETLGIRADGKVTTDTSTALVHALLSLSPNLVHIVVDRVRAPLPRRVSWPRCMQWRILRLAVWVGSLLPPPIYLAYAARGAPLDLLVTDDEFCCL